MTVSLPSCCTGVGQVQDMGAARGSIGTVMRGFVHNITHWCTDGPDSSLYGTGAISWGPMRYLGTHPQIRTVSVGYRTLLLRPMSYGIPCVCR